MEIRLKRGSPFRWLRQKSFYTQTCWTIPQTFRHNFTASMQIHILIDTWAAGFVVQRKTDVKKIRLEDSFTFGLRCVEPSWIWTFVSAKHCQNEAQGHQNDSCSEVDGTADCIFAMCSWDHAAIVPDIDVFKGGISKGFKKCKEMWACADKFQRRGRQTTLYLIQARTWSGVWKPLTKPEGFRADPPPLCNPVMFMYSCFVWAKRLKSLPHASPLLLGWKKVSDWVRLPSSYDTTMQ